MEKRQKDSSVISLHGIVKRFYIGKPNELEILHGIDLQVEQGEFVSIVGESGSGKSTLMNIIGALDRPTEGEYFLRGRNVGETGDKELSMIRNQEIGFVFQTYNLIPRTTALENVELPMLYGKVKRQNAVPGQRSFWNWWGWERGCFISRRNYPEARNRERPLPVPWRMILLSYWPMSRQVPLIPRPAGRLWIFSMSFTRSREKRSY